MVSAMLPLSNVLPEKLGLTVLLDNYDAGKSCESVTMLTMPLTPAGMFRGIGNFR